ncbi:insulinase family protein [Myxococcota bacterium]|nr:insulinase family protein [Myxococcota bacterium]
MRSRRSLVLPLVLAVLAGGCAPKSYVVEKAAHVATPPPATKLAVPAPERVEPRRVRLDNGLEVVVAPWSRRPVVSIRLVFGRGAATDSPHARGATYFAVAALGDLYEEDEAGNEMPPGERTLGQQLREIGARFFFDVESDHAMLAIDGYASDVERYLETLGRSIVVPRHGAEMFALRREAVYEEIEDVEAGDDETFFRYLGRAAFGVDHPYARPVYGNLAALKSLGHEQVVERQRQVLDPTTATLIVTGDVRPDGVIPVIQKAFGRWRPRQVARDEVIPSPEARSRDRVYVIPRRPSATMTICAARPLGDIVADDAALDVLAAIVGRTADSRLERALREESALAYSSSATVIRRRHARAFFACTRVLSEQARDGLTKLVATLGDVVSRPPTGDEVERARAVLLGELDDEDDDLAGRLRAELDAVSHGAPKRRGDKVDALGRVSIDDVQRLARTLLDPGSLQLLMAGEPGPARRAAEGTGLGRVEIVRVLR